MMLLDGDYTVDEFVGYIKLYMRNNYIGRRKTAIYVQLSNEDAIGIKRYMKLHKIKFEKDQYGYFAIEDSDDDTKAYVVKNSIIYQYCYNEDEAYKNE